MVAGCQGTLREAQGNAQREAPLQSTPDGLQISRFDVLQIGYEEIGGHSVR